MTKVVRVILLVLPLLLTSTGSVYAQSLRYKIERVFDETLRLHLGGSPGEHAGHFSPDNVGTSRQMINSLTTFIGANLSSFPLASSTASVTFDFSGGVPVRESTSLGPIFTERAKSLGEGRSVLGYSFSYMRFNKVRGIETQDLRFTFSHADVGLPGMGDSDNELDTIDLFMKMQLEASIVAFYYSYGVTSKFDVSVGVPLVNVRIEASPLANINSFTFVARDSANHFFDGTRTDPVLSTSPTPIDDDATGVGDIAIQGKYIFKDSKRYGLAALFGVRLATGDADNFLGAVDPNYRFGIIASADLSGSSPHLNVAYERRTSELDRDELEIFVGYDQKLSDRITIAADVLSEIEVGKHINALDFEESIEISRPVSDGTYSETVSLTNLPKFRDDNVINGSIGLKFAPRDFVVVVANALVPLNDGGLRAGLMGTLGFEFGF